MSDRPILFSGAMVRALLAGAKTQTRRVCVLPDPSSPITEFVKVATNKHTGRALYEMRDRDGQHVTIRAGKHSVTPHFSPRIALGDRLWVRETWTAQMIGGWTIADARRRMFQEKIIYQADGTDSIDGWWPSIHMPREFSRLTLTVTDVRIERLQDCSEADARAEGADGYSVDEEGVHTDGFAANYRRIWEAINGHGSWDANPWVAAYTFTVERGNIDQLARVP